MCFCKVSWMFCDGFEGKKLLSFLIGLLVSTDTFKNKCCWGLQFVKTCSVFEQMGEENLIVFLTNTIVFLVMYDRLET